MHVRADGEALVTGSADKDVKFWKFEHRDATDGSVSAKIVVLTMAITYYRYRFRVENFYPYCTYVH